MTAKRLRRAQWPRHYKAQQEAAESEEEAAETWFRAGWLAGTKGSSALSCPAVKKQDRWEWLAGLTEGIKEFRRELPRLGSAWETDGMRRGSDARKTKGEHF